MSNRNWLVVVFLFAASGGCLDSDEEPQDFTIVTEAKPLTPEEQAIVDAAVAVKGTATKSINNIHTVGEVSEHNSTWWRSPTAYCEYNNRLVGLGAAGPGNGSVLFRGLIPRQGEATMPVGTEAAAHEDLAGTTDNWSVVSYAVCAEPPEGLELVEAVSPASSSATRTWTADCPSGKRVLGAGGTITGGNGRVKVDEIRPNEGLTQVTVTASEDQDGTSSSWRVRAYAVCAFPPAGLVRVGNRAPNGWDGRTVTARCPGEKVALGASGGVDADVRTNLRVQSIAPSGRAGAYVMANTKGGDGGATGDVRAYAICIDG
jgi:hypothetical protein